jgi:PAS domain S-box-containing protein
MAETLRLFLIEDDDNIALLIRKSLERLDHVVTRCRTAADALIVLGQCTFDLVLLDQKLPDLTGLDLLQTLTREGIAVPVLMVTGEGDEHLATRVLHAGALDYIVKDSSLTFLVDLPKRVTESVTRHRLEHMNRLLIQSLESARDGILITDLQGVILHVNRSLEVLTGYSREEMVGRTPRLFKSGAHPLEFYAEMWRTVLARSGWQGELTNRRKDGQLFPASMTISPIVDAQGRLTHFVAIQRDITAQKSLEKQLLQAQKMQSVGTLAGGVAHEFNNLLAGINGYASLGLREADLSPTIREFFSHIVHLSERAAGLTRQLLAFARKPALTRQRTHLIDLLRSTAELVRRTLHQEVVVDLPASDWGVKAGEGPSRPEHGTGRSETNLVLPIVEADTNQLQQALVNLALNSRDAILERRAGAPNGLGHDEETADLAPAVVRPSSPEGGGRRRRGSLRERGGLPPTSSVVDGRAAGPSAGPVGDGVAPAIVFRLRTLLLASEQPGFPQRVPPGDYVVLEVADRGVGMTQEVLNQALDPFYTTKEVGQGTGLGLPMVFGIVQAHQGFLTIDSTPGLGTTVLIYLPRFIERPESGVRPVPAGLGEVVEPERATGHAILVIDDEEAVLDVVSRFLQIAGHRVRCCTRGQEACDLLLGGEEVDLVILDLMMPREDPVGLLQKIRQRRPAVPVLLCTGLAEAEPVPHLLRHGADGLIRKPFRMNELWYAVKQALR